MSWKTQVRRNDLSYTGLSGLFSSPVHKDRKRTVYLRKRRWVRCTDRRGKSREIQLDINQRTEFGTTWISNRMGDDVSTLETANHARPDRWRMGNGNIKIPILMQTKINGYHVGPGQNPLNDNQNSTHAINANNVGTFHVSKSDEDGTSKYCR